MSLRAHVILASSLLVLALVKGAIFLFIVFVCFVDLGRPVLTPDDIARTRWMLQMAGLAGLGMLGCTVGSAFLIFKIRILRLRELSSAVRDFEGSDFRSRFAAGERTLAAQDVDLLRESFAAMTDRIAGRIQQLSDAEDYLRSLVTEMSHDLRTPLALLQGYLETLSRSDRSLSAEEQREYLQIASHHADRLHNLISQLFELAELESPNVAINREPHPIQELAEDICNSFQLRAEAKQVALRCEWDAGLPLVNIDALLMERDFTNLMENAIRFTPEGGDVVVRLRRRDDAVETTVSDRGKGIGPTDLPFIFDRSYRSKDGGEHDGSGLGLAIVRRILQLHDAAIEVESTVGAGTMFTFRLPAVLNVS